MIIRNHLPLFTGRKRRKTDLIVLHWTGGTGDHRRVKKTLEARGISVHFVIDRDGSVWRMADVMMQCAHAKGVNGRSVGIEMVGKDGRFTGEQMDSAMLLCADLCRSLDVPMRVVHPSRIFLPSPFRGVCGHFNVSKTKWDPGPGVLGFLSENGFRAV